MNCWKGRLQCHRDKEKKQARPSLRPSDHEEQEGNIFSVHLHWQSYCHLLLLQEIKKDLLMRSIQKDTVLRTREDRNPHMILDYYELITWTRSQPHAFGNAWLPIVPLSFSSSSFIWMPTVQRLCNMEGNNQKLEQQKTESKGDFFLTCLMFESL